MARESARRCPACGHDFARDHSGWFWDRVEIQTRSQQANHMLGLPKSGGVRIRDTLERMRE